MPHGPDLIRETARTLPDAPGVYLYRDAEGTVIYVGKAKSLRKRVGSYARAGAALQRRTLDMVQRVAQIDTLIVESETEALLLEQSLIKEHRPAFNVRLRDDKSYPYIKITLEDEFPRVMFTREPHRRGVRYFGPYASASKVRETLDVLNRVFPYRPCEGATPGRRSGIPCLDYHIGRCLAPCVGYVSAEDYRGVIEGVVDVLEGRSRPIERRLEREMRAAAARERYEEAARARNRLQALQSIAERQVVDRAGQGDIDAIGIAREGAVALLQLLPIRSGRVGGRHVTVLENAEGATADELVAGLVADRYGLQGVGVPPLVLVPAELAERSELEALLAERRGARVEVRSPQRGEKRRLLEMAERNAEHALRYELVKVPKARAQRHAALAELRDSLGMDELPRRIECFDISNTMGEATVASMVVFEEGAARRSDYRLFGIERDGGPDDFASMAEAVRRRFARLQAAEALDDEAQAAAGDASFGRRPDLLVIDGGKGQLSAAVAELDELGVDGVAVIGLAKRLEEVFLPGRSDPLLLDDDAAGLLLLRAIRDEAHRFALTAHRKRRARASQSSMLEQVPGIGPTRRRALLQHFGSGQAILEATREELEAVPGLPAKTARQVYESLHRSGGSSPSASAG